MLKNMFSCYKRIGSLANYVPTKKLRSFSNRSASSDSYKFHTVRTNMLVSYVGSKVRLFTVGVPRTVRHTYDYSGFKSSPLILFSGILTFLGLKKQEEEGQVLIMTMKRAVLLIQKGEFKKAEQMLHIALKIAQDEQNQDAITYVYDLMANLAYEQGELVKAEKLFVSVMQRLLQSGVAQDDNKILHMSLKLTNIYTQNKQADKAEDGFKFCTSGLQGKVNKGANDEDTLLLWAMTLDWYARFLLEHNRLEEAFNCFVKAYDLSLNVNGPVHEQNVVLLNDLGTISCLKGDNVNALRFLKKAVAIGKNLPDMEDLGSVYVNLGNIYMKEGLYEEAKKNCEDGWKNGQRHNNKEILSEANKCLDELKLAFI